MDKLKIVKSHNYEIIKESLKLTNGNCPCLPKYIWDDKDTKCLCKQFKEQDFEGDCHCGAYRKVINEDK